LVAYKPSLRDGRLRKQPGNGMLSREPSSGLGEDEMPKIVVRALLVLLVLPLSSPLIAAVMIYQQKTEPQNGLVAGFIRADSQDRGQVCVVLPEGYRKVPSRQIVFAGKTFIEGIGCSHEGEYSGMQLGATVTIDNLGSATWSDLQQDNNNRRFCATFHNTSSNRRCGMMVVPIQAE
jgi:hypothetical protein